MAALLQSEQPQGYLAVDWETGAITATDDLSFGALDIGDARFPAFDLRCSDMDTQEMVYPPTSWTAPGAFCSSPGYDKNCNTWELCEPQCLHGGQRGGGMC